MGKIFNKYFLKKLFIKVIVTNYNSRRYYRRGVDIVESFKNFSKRLDQLKKEHNEKLFHQVRNHNKNVLIEAEAQSLIKSCIRVKRVVRKFRLFCTVQKKMDDTIMSKKFYKSFWKAFNQEGKKLEKLSKSLEYCGTSEDTQRNISIFQNQASSSLTLLLGFIERLKLK